MIHRNCAKQDETVILPDQNYYDNLCYCIYLCSNFDEHYRRKIITHLFLKTLVTFAEGIHIDCNHDTTGKKQKVKIKTSLLIKFLT